MSAAREGKLRVGLWTEVSCPVYCPKAISCKTCPTQAVQSSPPLQLAYFPFLILCTLNCTIHLIVGQLKSCLIKAFFLLLLLIHTSSDLFSIFFKLSTSWSIFFLNFYSNSIFYVHQSKRNLFPSRFTDSFSPTTLQDSFLSFQSSSLQLSSHSSFWTCNPLS